MNDDLTRTADEIARFFDDGRGGFRFARWTRPVAPVVFGAADESLGALKGAIEAVARLANHPVAETDPELGANLMLFFFSDWAELAEVPDLDRLVPDLATLLPRLTAADADQYRFFRFEADGAIRAACIFCRITGAMAQMPADDLALEQAVKAMLLWGEGAFAHTSPLARVPEGAATVLRPDMAAILRIAYDPALPAASTDRAQALRIAARMMALRT